MRYALSEAHGLTNTKKPEGNTRLHRTWIQCFVCLVAAACCSNAIASTSPGRCDDGSSTPADAPSSGWHFAWENDSLIGPYGSDRAYTQGIQLGFRQSGELNPAWLGRLLDSACQFLIRHSEAGNRSAAGAASISIGQLLYTPTDLGQSELIPYDRPYAAWLYGSIKLELWQPFQQPHALAKTGVFHTIEAQIGTLGPNAQGEWVQKNWHSAINAIEPRGWANQLPNEPGVQLRYSANGTVLDAAIGRGKKDWRLQSSILWSLNAGSIHVGTSVGTTLRFGLNLSDPVSERLSADAQALDVDGNSPTPSYCIGLLRIRECFVFLGVRGHGALFNAFLEGPLFRGGHSVKRKPWTYDYTWGVGARWTHLSLEYSSTKVSRQFAVASSPSLRTPKHGFGAVNARCLTSDPFSIRNLSLVCPGVFALLAGVVAAQ